jgi:hypothetical protein
MMTRENIGRNISKNKGYGMIMNIMMRKSLRSGKKNFLFGENSLEFRMHRGCLNHVNRVELKNNTGVEFLEDVFHAMENDDLRRTNCETLELILLSFMLELHG